MSEKAPSTNIPDSLNLAVNDLESAVALSQSTGNGSNSIRRHHRPHTVRVKGDKDLEYTAVDSHKLPDYNPSGEYLGVTTTHLNMDESGKPASGVEYSTHVRISQVAGKEVSTSEREYGERDDRRIAVIDRRSDAPVSVIRQTVRPDGTIEQMKGKITGERGQRAKEILIQRAARNLGAAGLKALEQQTSSSNIEAIIGPATERVDAMVRAARGEHVDVSDARLTYSKDEALSWLKHSFAGTRYLRLLDGDQAEWSKQIATAIGIRDDEHARYENTTDMQDVVDAVLSDEKLAEQVNQLRAQILEDTRMWVVARDIQSDWEHGRLTKAEFDAVLAKLDIPKQHDAILWHDGMTTKQLNIASGLRNSITARRALERAEMDGTLSSRLSNEEKTSLRPARARSHYARRSMHRQSSGRIAA